MRKFALVALASTSLISAAAAQQMPQHVPPGSPQDVLHGIILDHVPDKEARVVDIVNCAIFKGKPYICINNDTDKTVTNIDCEWSGIFGGNKTAKVEMPPGNIAPWSTTAVYMPGCKGTVVFTITGGRQRRLPNVNSDNMTEISVPQK